MIAGREPRDICLWDIRVPTPSEDDGPVLVLPGRAGPDPSIGGGGEGDAGAASAPYAGPCGMCMAVAAFEPAGGPAVLAGYAVRLRAAIPISIGTASYFFGEGGGGCVSP